MKFNTYFYDILGSEYVIACSALTLVSDGIFNFECHTWWIYDEKRGIYTAELYNTCVLIILLRNLRKG